MGINKRVLVTGATGFVGRRLLSVLASRAGWSVHAAARRPDALPPSLPAVSVPTLDGETDWSGALQRVDAVVHLAARVHVMQESDADPQAAFRRANVDGTLALARQAAEAGVQRFVFISSIKVNGEHTAPGVPFTADDKPNPQDPYGQSKAEAESALRALAVETGMEVVILRPPLIYGPEVKANFAAMMRWLHKGVPLPLANTGNARSLLALDNLVDLIIRCLDHPAAANQTFLASDGEDLSTSELLRRMGDALGRPARLVPFPCSVIRLVATLVGRQGIYQRLFGSLQLDIRKTRQTLDWTPPLSVKEGLQQVASDFNKD